MVAKLILPPLIAVSSDLDDLCAGGFISIMKSFGCRTRQLQYLLGEY